MGFRAFNQRLREETKAVVPRKKKNKLWDKKIIFFNAQWEFKDNKVRKNRGKR